MKKKSCIAQFSRKWEVSNSCKLKDLKRYINVIASAEHLLLAMNSPSLEISEAQIEEHLSDLERRWLTGAGSVTNIYDLLISSGKLELLNSIEVKETLRNLNSHLETLLTYEEIQAYFVDNRLNPYLNQYIDRISITARRLDLNESLNTSRFRTSYNELLNDSEFANLLIELIKHSRPLVQTYDRMGSQIATIESITAQNCLKDKSVSISSTE